MRRCKGGGEVRELTVMDRRARLGERQKGSWWCNLASLKSTTFSSLLLIFVFSVTSCQLPFVGIMRTSFPLVCAYRGYEERRGGGRMRRLKDQTHRAKQE